MTPSRDVCERFFLSLSFTLAQEMVGQHAVQQLTLMKPFHGVIRRSQAISYMGQIDRESLSRSALLWITRLRGT